MHPSQDDLGDRLGGVAPLGLVAVQLPDPLQVDDRYDADEQVHVLGDVDLDALPTEDLLEGAP